jgi:sterol desaturase/sphingolipid hydroxylase (fatty acid hydroxylase superfamily)
MTLNSFLASALSPSNFASIGFLLAAMAVVSAIELLIPLHARKASNNAHLAPNLLLTLIYFATNLFFTAALVLLLVWLDAAGFGLLNIVTLDPWLEIAATVVVLDFQAYAVHAAMHHSPGLWRFHRVHHSDPTVDVTTALRQHPGESVIRFISLSIFACALGASLSAFALYRVLSALQALSEHANIRLPQSLDNFLSLMIASPNYHKVHHSRDASETDTNYANILSLWDRIFGTHTPASRGVAIAYGLDGFDYRVDQTPWGLIALPFRQRDDDALKVTERA